MSTDPLPDIVQRLRKQHGALQIGEPCSRWTDAIEASDEIVRLRALLEERMVHDKKTLAARNTVERLGFQWAGGVEWKLPPGELWLPIATAPRSSRVLVTNLGYRNVVSIATQWHQGNNVWVWRTDDDESEATGYFLSGEPTHWMPLPISPLE